MKTIILVLLSSVCYAQITFRVDTSYNVRPFISINQEGGFRYYPDTLSDSGKIELLERAITNSREDKKETIEYYRSEIRRKDFIIKNYEEFRKNVMRINKQMINIYKKK